MKTIGQIIKETRVDKKYSLSHIEGLTKIRASFIDSIEKEDWDSLPAFPTVLGFVKSLSTTLGIDPKMAVAVLKRDYPPKKLRITPKPDAVKKLNWSPKLTFTLGISVVLVVLFGYLILQYIHFISPPRLFVESPGENQVVNGRSLIIFGSTELDAKVTVNNQPVMTSDDGKFSVSLDVVPTTNEIIVQASSRSGKTTTVSRKIIVK